MLLAIFLALPSIDIVHSLAVNSSLLRYELAPSTLLATTSANATDVITSCNDLNSCRSLYSIVQTCLATIFACVWVAVHRNIPAPKKNPKWSSNALLRAAQWVCSQVPGQKQTITVFAVTLLAPEWVLAWAIRQAIRAGRLKGDLEKAREIAKRKWEVIYSDPKDKNMAEMDENKLHCGDELSSRFSLRDNVTVIAKQLDKSVECM